jgi:Na+/proline symporter
MYLPALTAHSLIALAIILFIHIHFLDGGLHSTNQTFDQITPSILEQVQLCWTLVAATIPCLKAFIATLGSGYLGGHFDRDFPLDKDTPTRAMLIIWVQLLYPSVRRVKWLPGGLMRHQIEA